MQRIGIIDNAAIWDHFRQGLSDLGYVEGGNIAIEYRSAEGRPERLVAAATELAELPVECHRDLWLDGDAGGQTSNDDNPCVNGHLALVLTARVPYSAASP